MSTEEPPQYATEAGQVGVPVGPEHDKSFHAEDYYDPNTGKRLETDWDTEAQKNLPDVAPQQGQVEQPAPPSGGETPPEGETSPPNGGSGGASGGEGGEVTPP